jgi:hypothetical protein
MIRCDCFARSVVFAAVAAAGCLPWAVLAVPLVGPWRAQALYLVVVAVLYTAAIAPRKTGARRSSLVARCSGVPAALLVAGLALPVMACAHSTTELAIGLAALLGIARSGLLYRATPARAVLTEAVLLVGGLLFARALADTSWPSTALALWGFLLVQSLFFLVPAVRPRAATAPPIDPFEEAYRHAMALLDRTTV